MFQPEVRHIRRSCNVARAFATVVTLVLLPPFVALAILPMLLLLLPVALIGIPFLLPAMLSGSLAARAEARQRESWRPAARPLRVLH